MSINRKQEDGTLEAIVTISSNHWIGTRAQYEIDNAAGLVPDGTIVEITDDVDDETIMQEIDGVKKSFAELNSKLGNLSWKTNSSLSQTGSTEITLPSDYNELLVKIKPSGTSATYVIHLCKEMLLDSYSDTYTSGSYYSSSNYHMINVFVSKTKAKLSGVYVNSSDRTSTSTIDIYYK